MLMEILDSREGTSMKRLTIIGLVVAAGVAGIAIGATAAFGFRSPRLAAFPAAASSRVEVIPPRGMFESDDMYPMERFDNRSGDFSYFGRMPYMMRVSPLAIARRGFGLWAALSVVGAVTGVSALVLTLARRPRLADGPPPANPLADDLPVEASPAA